MEHLIGQPLNHRYAVISVLGEGGMGTVLKGFDPILERDVAIKVMHPHFSSQPNLRERFLQEARTAGKLNHPSIVKVYDFGQQESLLFIVMEFIEGDNLRSMLDGMKTGNRWIPLHESLLSIAQIASALDYAHRHGVLHRDIKPANIMIVPEPTSGLPYRPVLTDLGLAKLLEGHSITREGVSMGTPAYMSPEQAMGQSIDARSDVYSLGILLFELCTGKPPFPAKSISDAIRYHTKEPPPLPRSIRVDIPLPVEDVILKAIAKEPAKRFDNAEELSQALRSINLVIPGDVPGEAKSIITEYQKSLADRGKSIQREIKPVINRFTDVLQVMDVNKQTAIFNITTKTITIGRGKDNDLVIEDVKLSRQHAKIEFDGKDYTVTDLKSTNGTYLDNTKLLPGVPELWQSGKVLRLGNTWLNLKLANKEVQEPITDRYTKVLHDDVLSLAHSITGKRVTATIASDQLSVDPGSSLSVPVQLLNHGQLVDHYHLKIEGVPSEWITVPERGVQLMPREKSEIQFSIHPPRQPESKAGEYPITILVVSQITAGDITKVGARLRVTPYYQFDFVIRPQRQRGVTEGQFSTVLRNLCNTDLTFDLGGEDPEDRCQFCFEPAVILTQPGHESTGKLMVKPKTPISTGVSRTYGFTVTARARESNELLKQSFGEWIKTPLLLDIQIKPPLLRSVGSGLVQVILRNQGETDLPIQLEADDDEAVCNFHFDPRSIVIPVGGERQSKLTLSCSQKTSSNAEKQIGYWVTARMVESPDLSQRAEAQWIILLPSFEAFLSVIQGTGEDQGQYTLTVRNLSDAELAVNLLGVDQTQKCIFEFYPAEITLPPHGEKNVQLLVKPRQFIFGETQQKHNFQVVVQPTGYSGIEKRLDAVWEQLAKTKTSPLFWCWLLISLGWALALFIGGIVLNTLGSFSGGSESEILIAGLIAGIFTGGIGGLMTGLGLKTAHSGIRFSHIIGLMIAWSVLWSFLYGPLVLFLFYM